MFISQSCVSLLKKKTCRTVVEKRNKINVSVVNNVLFNNYSYDQQFTLKYLKDTEVNLNNILTMIRDFNIRDNKWNLLYSYHSNHTNSLKEIADSFNIELSTSVNQVPMQYTNNSQDSNSVLDLMFFCFTSEELNNQMISSYL